MVLGCWVGSGKVRVKHGKNIAKVVKCRFCGRGRRFIWFIFGGFKKRETRSFFFFCYRWKWESMSRGWWWWAMIVIAIIERVSEARENGPIGVGVSNGGMLYEFWCRRTSFENSIFTSGAYQFGEANCCWDWSKLRGWRYGVVWIE